ncbi:sensor domain-containing diguanylate cyclase [Thiohalorhabdus sp.]|uniref:sensor domain-containing diguanylate cyclase n=1 Tax=Thiohalorhabdus sp. TaxID=3094134 RepID=UPI002FC28F48
MQANGDVPHGFYRTILDHLRDVVFQTDAEGRWEFLNPAWTDITGFEVAPTLGRSFLDFIHPDDRDCLLAEFQSLAGGEKAVCHYETRYLTSEGGHRWMALHARRIAGNHGEMAGVLGTLTDITARKELEATLNREKERAQTTLRSIGDGVIVTEANGRIQLLNPQAERLLGWSAGAARGRLLAEVFRVTDEAGQPVLTEPSECPSDRVTGQGSGVNAWLDRAEGEQMAVEWSAAPVAALGEEEPGCVVVFRNVTAQRTLQQQLAYQATHDVLTGLLNRAALQEAIAHEAARAERNGHSFSLILLDLDRFKMANDKYGHNAGDRVLEAMAERIPRQMREADWFGRWGGEEFLCLLPGAGSEQAVRIAERLRTDIMDHPVPLEENAIPVTASFGVATFPEDAQSTEDLIRIADTRLYEAKRAGRNRVEAGW